MINFSSLASAMRLGRTVFYGLLAFILLVWSLAGFFMQGEDEINKTVKWLIVLGGGIAGERLQLACDLYAEGHGSRGVVLTGSNVESFVSDRAGLLRKCGIPDALLIQWPTTENSYEEMSKVRQYFISKPTELVIVVSDTLHMPRLHFLRDKLGLNGSVLFRQSHFLWPATPDYMLRVIRFWFREPVAYIYYRLKYL